MRHTDDHSPDGEGGFGLVEVLVSMALLLIVSLSLLPVYVSALKLSASNVSITTSTQLVSQNMDLARSLLPNCARLKAFVAETVGVTELDPQGRTLVVHRSTDAACPTTYPATMSFTVWVGYENSTTKLATAQTLIHVSSAAG